MKKPDIYKIVLFLILFFPSFPLSLYAFEEKPMLAVLDFSADRISASEVRSITSILTAELFNTGLFTVIDIGQRDSILKELDFSLSGCTDEECMLEIGRMLSAEIIAAGNIGRVGSKYVLSSKIIETETARTLSTANGIYKSTDALLDDIGNLVDQLTLPYMPSAAEEAETPPDENRLTGTRIAAIASFSASLASASIGGYFLTTSLPYLIRYGDAKSAYETADDPAIAGTLWNIYESSRIEAAEADAERNFIIGASCAGAGIALGIVSAVLFGSQNRAEEKTDVGIALLPAPGRVTLAFHYRNNGVYSHEN